MLLMYILISIMDYYVNVSGTIKMLSMRTNNTLTPFFNRLANILALLYVFQAHIALQYIYMIYVLESFKHISH